MSLVILLLVILIIVIIFIKKTTEKPMSAKEVNNFRDIPFEGDLIMSYYPGHREKLMNSMGLFFAYLVKWVKENRILFVLDNENNYYMDISQLGEFDEPTDILLAGYLKSIANDNKITLEDYKNNIKTNYNEIHNWAYQVEIASKKKLEINGYVVKKKNSYKCDYTEKGIIEINRLKGLKQFIVKMSSLSEKQFSEVELWDNFLVYAAAFDVTSIIKEQLHGFYPKLYIKVDRGEF